MCYESEVPYLVNWTAYKFEHAWRVEFSLFSVFNFFNNTTLPDLFCEILWILFSYFQVGIFKADCRSKYLEKLALHLEYSSNRQS